MDDYEKEDESVCSQKKSVRFESFSCFYASCHVVLDAKAKTDAPITGTNGVQTSEQQSQLHTKEAKSNLREQFALFIREDLVL
jgi:hypothetical protein